MAGAVDIATHQRLAQEDRVRQRGVLLLEGDRPLLHQHQAEQADLLVRHHAATLPRPVRVAATGAQQVRGLLLDPQRLDARIRHAPHAPAHVEDLRGEQPVRRCLRQRRTGKHLELALARALVDALLVLAADLGGQAGEQAAMDGFVQPIGIALAPSPATQGSPFGASRGRSRVRILRLVAGGSLCIQLPPQFLHHQQQLPMQFAPFAHAHEAEEMPRAPVAQLRLGQFLVRVVVGAPQIQHADEVGLRVGEHGVRGVGLLARIARALARILDAEEGHDGEQFAQAVQLLAFHQHARQLHVDRQPRQRAADRGELARVVDRGNLGEPAEAVGDHARVGRFQERKLVDLAQLQRQHAQDHVGQRRAQQFRIGERGAAGEVGLVVEAIADARPDAAAAALALVGGGLGNRLHVQPLELAALAVALDPRGAGVDHVADARHRERGLGDVGGQHHAALHAGLEHAVLVAGREPRIQRHDLGLAVLPARQQQMRIADLALAGQEDQHVAARVVVADFIQHRGDMLGAALLHVLAAALPRGDFVQRAPA